MTNEELITHIIEDLTYMMEHYNIPALDANYRTVISLDNFSELFDNAQVREVLIKAEEMLDQAPADQQGPAIDFFN